MPESEFICPKKGTLCSNLFTNLLDLIRENNVGVPEGGAKVRCNVFENKMRGRIIPMGSSKNNTHKNKYWQFVGHV